MISGFAGHLIAEQFLDRFLDRHAGRSSPPLATLRQWRSSQQSLGPATSVRTMLESGCIPLVGLLGFDAVTNLVVTDDFATAVANTGRSPIVLGVTRWGEQLNQLWRPVICEANRCGARWCLLFNGTHLRVVHAARVFSRRYVEFDLDCAAEDERATLALWTVASAQALTAPDGGNDRESVASTDAIVAASERHGSAVCRSLRDGVLEASQHLLRALVSTRRSQNPDEAFDQALTIVYRILFLFFSEARLLVPSWHPIYRNSYSLEGLRDVVIQGSTIGLWDALRAITRLAHSGCRAGDLRVTAFNGRLFAPSQTPLAERRDLDDEAAGKALIALSTRPAADRHGLEPIAYRDLGVEQLGAVYETLLDYSPAVQPNDSTRSRQPARISLEAGSGIRKATGTFYTPQSIVGYVVRQTLRPLVAGASPDEILNLKILDPSMGSGAFLVGACTYLADAYEAAMVRVERCHPSDIGPSERALIRRTIAERCLFGVDVNPMAVQLARLSLWLATLAGDRPLSFLDHHLQVGDSLLGAWLSSLRHPPTGRRAHQRALPLFDDLPAADALSAALPVRFTFEREPNDTPEQVRAKERALATLTDRESSLSKWKRVANLWCARWFATQPAPAPALFQTLADAILTGNCSLPAAAVRNHLDESEAIAARRRFFHWELEFPEVFFDRQRRRRNAPGFDAVIGNPPWDMVRADAGSQDARGGLRAETAAVVRFTRDSGIYAAQSEGHANRYQMFLERSIALTRTEGRVGLVLPAGLLTDHGSAPLRRLLFSGCGVDALVAFDNKHAIFPIHRSIRFVLMSATAGLTTNRIGCRFGAVDPGVLDRAAEPDGRDFPVYLTPTLLERISGSDLIVPDLRSSVDVAIIERAATLFAPIGSANGWAARFGRELNATEDRALFNSERRGVPVIEGKAISPFRVDRGAVRYSLGVREARRQLGNRFERARLAYRDVASATNRLTLIAAVIPAGVVTTHTIFCLRTRLPSVAQYFLCGLFNSLVVNYLVRLRVTMHVTTSVVERLPVPSADQAGAAYRQIARIARYLQKKDDTNLFGILNARVARLYQFSDSELAHVLATFPLVSPEIRSAVVAAFRNS